MPEQTCDASPFKKPLEAAAYLRLNPRTLDNMRQRGTGPVYVKHGGRVVYHQDDLLAWSRSRRQRTPTEREPPPAKPDTPSDEPNT